MTITLTEPRIGSLFSGTGALDMGVQAVIGGKVVWHVENDSAPARILAHHFPDAPNHGDITKVDWHSVEPIDVLTGGFPCPDLSLAGRRAGMRPGTRSGLWADFLKAIEVLRPRLVVIENVRGLLSGCAESESDSELGPCPRCADPASRADHAPNVRALARVLLDLASLGYVGRWGSVEASDAGAPHERFRVFVVAYPVSQQPERWGGPGELGATSGAGEGDGSERQRLRDAPLDRGEEASNASYLGHEWSGTSWDRRDGSADGGEDAADPDISGLALSGSRGVTSQEVGQSRSAALRDPAPDPWGEYADAIHHWEQVLGRPAPAPTDSSGRLSPLLTEWMMGLPEGHVTNPAIWEGMTPSAARKAMIRACGNGVVWQQAALALSILLGGLPHSIGSEDS